MQHDEKYIPRCVRFSDISEYLDGELSPSDELSLERHIAACTECKKEFNVQKQFHNALSSTLEQDDERFELPDNFSKVIVAAAASDVGTIRRSSEVRNAFAIMLGIVVFAALIISIGGGVSAGGFRSITEKAIAVLFAIGHLIYTIALGVSVALRSLTAGIAKISGLWLLLAGVVAMLLLIPVVYFRPRRSRSA